MQNIGSLSIKLALVIAAFVLTLSAIYIWALPKFFGGYKTYSFFVIGVGGAALVSGYVSYRSVAVTGTIGAKLMAATFCGLIAAIFVAFLALLIILNVMGS